MSLSRCASDVSCYGFSVDLVEQHYRAWVVIPFYVVVTGYNEHTQNQEYGCFRSAKRGDKKYSNKVKAKFEALENAVPKVSYFPWGTRNKAVIRSPCAFLTFEFDPNRFSCEDSWLLAGTEFNRYITGKRKKYGKIDVVRVFESHESGYCHIHAVLWFHEKEWTGFRWDNKGKIKYRVNEVETLKEGWHGGFSDVLLMQNSHSGFRYLAKYLTKCIDFEKEDVKSARTLSMCWYFRERSFGVSGSLLGLYSDVINTLKSNSNLNCDVEIGFDGSVVFCGVAEWFLHGFVRGFVEDWGDHWRKIPIDQLLKLENLGYFEKR